MNAQCLLIILLHLTVTCALEIICVYCINLVGLQLHIHSFVLVA